MVSAGRVLIMPKWAWNSTDTYSLLDLVSYNGSSYVAKTSVPANTLPTNTSYWQLSAYGGSASNVDGNFALTETTDYASRNYTVGDFLVTKDSVFCKVKASITTGDQLVMDTNIEATSVAALYDAVIDYADGLDEKNVKLQGQTAITTQTDLNDLTTVGNYYKSSTSVYVTNAPTGIASELTAVFRLTVENGSDTTNKYIQTLRTNDGKTYTRGYNGSVWGDWIEDASAASVALKQPKTLDTPITVGDTQQTTVEGTLGALNNDLSNEVAVRATLGAHNLFDFFGYVSSSGASVSKSGNTFSVNDTNYGSLFSTRYKFSDTDVNVVLSGTITDQTGGYSAKIDLLNSNDVITGRIDSTTPTASGSGCELRLNWASATGRGTFTISQPMLRLATDTDTTYTPYAKTNREMTDDVIPAEITPTWGVNVNVYADTHFYKVGKVLYTFFQIAAKTDAIPANAWYTLAELPSGIRPKAQSRAIVLYDGTTPMPLLFTSDGLIRIYPKSQLAVGDQITGCCFTILK